MMSVPQDKRAEVKPVLVEKDMRIGLDEEGDVFDADTARKRVEEITERLKQLVASHDKLTADLDHGRKIAAEGVLKISPELVKQLEQETQDKIDDLKLDTMRLEREKEGLEMKLKM